MYNKDNLPFDNNYKNWYAIDILSTFLALKDIEQIKYSRYITLYNQRLLSSIYWKILLFKNVLE